MNFELRTLRPTFCVGIAGGWGSTPSSRLYSLLILSKNLF